MKARLVTSVIMLLKNTKFNQITVLILVSYLLVISNGIFRYIQWSPKWALKAVPDMPYTIPIFFLTFWLFLGMFSYFQVHYGPWNQCTTSCPPPFQWIKHRAGQKKKYMAGKTLAWASKELYGWEGKKWLKHWPRQAKKYIAGRERNS